jgi:uncharacterized protein YjbI with pentapeptide repeats
METVYEKGAGIDESKQGLIEQTDALQDELSEAPVRETQQIEQYDVLNDEFTWDSLESQSALPAQLENVSIDESILNTPEELSPLLTQSRFQQFTHQQNALPSRNEMQRQYQQISHPQISQPSPAVRMPTEETRYHEALGAVVVGQTIDENYAKPPERFTSALELQQIKQRQLEMLKSHDVEAWSQWRQAHPNIRPDLTGADLHGLDLREFDLSGVKLVGANLRGANLTQTDLSGADLSNATLVKTEFRGADLRHAKLVRANMTDADLSEAILQDVDLTQAVSSKKTDLTGADMTDAILTGANLSGANLTGAILKGANLSECILIRAILVDAIMVEADLSKAYLNFAILQGVNLRNAKLVDTNFRGADLRGANLIKANMTNADLSEAILQDVDLTQDVSKKTNLTEANLTEAILTGANLSGAILKKANFNGVSLSKTIFKNVDLRETIGLETAVHFESSVIDIDTIYLSRSNISREFLQSAGVPDIIIDSMLVNANHPMKYHTCFISYSSKDEAFANRLVTDLRRLGVQCWFAPENMIIGEDFAKRIDISIRDTDKLVVILSEHSIQSSWVEKEVQTASHLLPIQIDNAVASPDQAWAKKIRNEDHIGNFSDWEQSRPYLSALAHLLQALKSDT